jgi:hypothetical protein
MEKNMKFLEGKCQGYACDITSVYFNKYFRLGL